MVPKQCFYLSETDFFFDLVTQIGYGSPGWTFPLPDSNQQFLLKQNPDCLGAHKGYFVVVKDLRKRVSLPPGWMPYRALQHPKLRGWWAARFPVGKVLLPLQPVRVSSCLSLAIAYPHDHVISLGGVTRM